MVAFCTPEYLFGTPSAAGYLEQFSTLLSKQDCFCAITIDEAH